MLKRLWLQLKRFVSLKAFKSLRQKSFLGVLMGLALLILAGLVLIDAREGSGGIELILDAPAETKSGESVFYAVRYKNLTNLDLENVEIKLIVPNGMIVV